MERGKTGQDVPTWGNVLSCKPELYFTPADEGEIREILKAAREKKKHVRVVGKSHTLNGLQFSPDYVICTERMKYVLEVDKENNRVTVEGGITVTELHQELDKHGLAMSVMSVVSDVTLAGAVMTGTHGSGGKFGTVSSYVTAFDFMLASGEIKSCSSSENPEIFKAGVCSLGALGIMLRLTLQCEPAFRLAVTQYTENMETVLENLDERVASCDHFNIMGFPHTDKTLVGYSSRVDTPPPPQTKASMVEGVVMYAVFQFIEFLLWLCTFYHWLMPYINKFMLVVAGGRKDVVDASYNTWSVPIPPTQYVAEWAVPRDNGPDMIRRINTWIVSNKFPAPFPLVVRFARADDLWLSPAYGRDTCYIQLLVIRPKAIPTRAFFDAVAEMAKEVGGRPHWAKDIQCTVKDFKGMYPKWDDFLRLRKSLDPAGMFLNEKLAEIFGVSSEY